MRKTGRWVLSAAVLALASVAAQGGPVSPETVAGVVKKADYLVVGQVVKVEEVGADQSDLYKVPLVHKRALLRILRGMKSADATPGDFVTMTVDYYGVKEGAARDGPNFPQLQVGQLGLFPVKAGGAGGAGGQWRFASEEDNGLIVPAVPTEIGIGWPATLDGNVAFIYRELAGCFLYGDFGAMCRAAAYLDQVGDGDKGADIVFGLIRAEIGDSLLKEDGRWISIAAAGYISGPVPRPTLDALINGRAAGGGGAARAPTDGLPARASLRISALAFAKVSKAQLAERMLMLLISHQEDPGMQWGIAKALADNYDGAPMMVSVEESVVHSGKPGAMYVADYLIKDEAHPLAAAACLGAREVLTYNGAAREFDASVPFSPLLRQAVGLILRAGSEDDFKYLMAMATQAKERDFKTYQGILLLAGDSELSPPKRVLQLCQLYIDDRTLMTKGPFAGMRVCDMAAMTAARIGKQDFGFSPTDGAEKKDEAVAKAAAWLKKRGA